MSIQDEIVGTETPRGAARSSDAATFTPDPYLVATSLAPDAVVARHAALQYRGRTYSVWN
jgi:hypothetical protein